MSDRDTPCSDTVVEENVKFLRDRSNVGVKKYGVTLDRPDLTPVQWVQHLREELADALNYATVIQRKMDIGLLGSLDDNYENLCEAVGISTDHINDCIVENCERYFWHDPKNGNLNFAATVEDLGTGDEWAYEHVRIYRGKALTCGIGVSSHGDKVAAFFNNENEVYE